ncbi:MAG: SDR family NAD(P)-dependent oxidoreductase [Proteobacteria bacterium]|nr:SDR family NAD(P)-dependent oxidoreductase [Pseudomonadota bacterium]
MTNQPTNKCPIAIVGMACRYPDADNVEQLFENSLALRRSFRKIPEIRLGSAYFDDTGSAKDLAYAQQGAVLKKFQFDRESFLVSKNCYDVTDLTHWLALTVVKETIKDIRFRKHQAPNNETVRVVVGNTLSGEFSRAGILRLRWPYVRKVVARHLQLQYPDLDDAGMVDFLRNLETDFKNPFPVPNEDFLAGGLANTIAGRICNYFDFKGGGFTVDGACASSLLAVIDACSALAAGDADLVFAGGVDLSLDPLELVGFSRTQALAGKEMLVYDEHSNGFWPGEGCGFVALMRYEEAIQQCEQIHAVIQGWGISSDGRGGLTRPEPEGQKLALQRCYKRAGYNIGSVGFFEGHGTGTKVGDTAELEALIAARKNESHLIQPAVISSIKANIGHTKAASGLAGLLRATKCVSEKILPPTTACRRPHTLLADNTDNLNVSCQWHPWESNGQKRRAGISAMGFGGINTHLTIEEGPESMHLPVNGDRDKDRERMHTFQDAELFLFAGWKREDLQWYIGHVAGFAHECSLAELTDLAVELARRTSHNTYYSWKAAVLAATPSQLSHRLQLLKKMLESCEDKGAQLEISDGVYLSAGSAHGRIGLIFPGQGAPLRAEGGLYARRFQEVAHTFQQAGLSSLTTQEDTDLAQPTIVAASLAGLGILNRVGIQGDLAIGHSLGELTALHWAGCFSQKELFRLARERGLSMAREQNSSGAMAAVAADYERTRLAVGGWENLFVANINAPEQTVVSGHREAVEGFSKKLRKEGISSQLLPVKHAFHTPFMGGAARAFAKTVNAAKLSAVNRKVISTVTGREMATDTIISEYLCHQILSPVRFMPAVTLASREVDLFIEVGPGALMTNLIRTYSKTPAISIDVGGTSLMPCLNAMACAYVLGRAPQIGQLYHDRFARRFDWVWNPRFLQNPCESVSKLSETNLENDVATERKTVPDIERTENDNSAIDRLRRIIANQTGLPAWSLQENSRMLSDIHLNSITVSSIVGRFYAASGFLPPINPTEFANASIVEIVTALEQLIESGAGRLDDQSIIPSGIGAWVRYFGTVLVPAPQLNLRQAPFPGTWEGYGCLTFREKKMLTLLNSGSHGNGVIIWVDKIPDTTIISPLLQAAQRCIERAGQSDNAVQFVIVQNGRGAGGFARTFFLENQKIRTRVINLVGKGDADQTTFILREIDDVSSGFVEIFVTTEGLRLESRLRRVTAPSATQRTVHKNDVILVTGGGKGISAECGYQLARQTGCALLILGRSGPEDNLELAENLKRMKKAGIRLSYQQADVTNRTMVTDAVVAGAAKIGAPVTGIVHGAGMNHPQMIGNLTVDDIQKTVRPKVTGLRNLIAAIDPNRLKLLIGFGSIIARIGLHGEADYALANEWLSNEIETFQLHHPKCRCYAMEWSIWSGTGMGQRLGRLDALENQGISPISIDEGVQQFLRLVDTPDLPVSLIISGRFGNPSTINLDVPPQNKFRFIQRIPVYYPGTELIAECSLSPESDPYLDDHMLNGDRLFPVVMALEAMAQAAVTLMGNDTKKLNLVFKNIVLHKAIVVPAKEDSEDFRLRIAALVRTDGVISLVIRSSETIFQVNHVEASCSFQKPTAMGDLATRGFELPSELIHPFDPDHALYQNILFQKGRFQRIKGYHLIEASRCRGQLSSDNTVEWFANPLPSNSLLGDPGARDASLHALQACIPHKIVIPIDIGSVRTGVLNPQMSYKLYAQEIERRKDELVFDLTILDRDNRPVEFWEKITVRVVGEPPCLSLTSPPLVASFFERRMAEITPGAGLKVVIQPATGRENTRPKIDQRYRPDGKPDPLNNLHFQSRSFSGGWKLTVDSAIPVGCDLQSVMQMNTNTWQSLLNGEGFKLAEVAASITGDRMDISATRVWTVSESMKKIGQSGKVPLVVDPDSSPQWAVFRSGEFRIYSSLISSTQTEDALCIAVAVPWTIPDTRMQQSLLNN